MLVTLLPSMPLSFSASLPFNATLRPDLRPDHVPVVLMPPGYLEKEFASLSLRSFPFKSFSELYVAQALADPIDWATLGAVTPAKDQGSHGYCGTFGRTAACEGQYALKTAKASVKVADQDTHTIMRSARNFSEEQLVDCIGWNRDQVTYWQSHGFMSMEDYPYDTSGPDTDPPVPGHPCMYNSTKVVGLTDRLFTNTISVPADEKQLTAFVHHNGPINTGIYSGVFGLRTAGCEKTNNCFITREMCASVEGKSIDHSITLTGYGTDPTHGDFWLVKNSWSTAFANQGFIKVARGVGCAHIDCCGFMPTYGSPEKYFPS